MGKSNPYTPEWLRQQGMVEVSPGVYQKQKPLTWLEKQDKAFIKQISKESRELIKKFPSKNQFADGFLSKITNVNRIQLKPLSVNQAWQGKRFKTPQYKAYEIAALSMLPKIYFIEPPLKLNLIFGVSSKLADIDNPVKLVIDILQKKYQFNDKEIYEMNVKKVLVNKREEYFEFEILHLDL